MYSARGQLLAFFNGVALLGEARLLDARRTVVPWPFVTAVLRHAPTLELVEGPDWAEDQRIWSAEPGALDRARRWLEDHLQSPYSLADTAQAASVSPRSLLRHFRAAFGQTPLQMLHGMRITRARMLLEDTFLLVEGIAERCGWRDVAMLRNVFRRVTGTTPAACRARFRLLTDRRRWGSDLPATQASAKG